MPRKKTVKELDINKILTKTEQLMNEGDYHAAYMELQPIARKIQEWLNSFPDYRDMNYVYLKNTQEERVFSHMFRDTHKAIQLEEDYVTPLIYCAKILMHFEDIKSATNLLRIARDLNPVNTELLLMLAECTKNQKFELENDANIAVLLTSISPKSISIAYKNIANIMLKKKKMKLAHALFYYSYKFNQSDPEVATQLLSLSKKKDFKYQLDDLNVCNVLLSNNIPIAFNYQVLEISFYSLSMSGDFIEENILDSVFSSLINCENTELDNTHQVVQDELFEIIPTLNVEQTIVEVEKQMSKGRTKKALEMIEKLIFKINELNLNNEDSKVEYLYFRNKTEKVYYQRTVSSSRLRILLKENFANAFSCYANVLVMMNNHKKAIEQLIIASKFNPVCSLIYFNMAFCYYNLGDINLYLNNINQSLCSSTNYDDLNRCYANLAMFYCAKYVETNEIQYKNKIIAMLFLTSLFDFDQEGIKLILHEIISQLKIQPTDYDLSTMSETLSGLDISVGLPPLIVGINIEQMLAARQIGNSEESRDMYSLIDDSIFKDYLVSCMACPDVLESFENDCLLDTWHNIFTFDIYLKIPIISKFMFGNKIKEAKKLLEEIIHQVESKGYFINTINQKYVFFDTEIGKKLYEKIYGNIEKIIKMPEDYGMLYSIYGIILMELEKLEKAKTYLYKALEYSPVDPHIAYNLCDYYIKIGDMKKLYQLLDKSYKITSTSFSLSRYYSCLAYYHNEMKNINLAISLHKLSLHLDNENSFSKNELFKIAKKKNQFITNNDIESDIELIRSNGIKIGVDDFIRPLLKKLAEDDFDLTDEILSFLELR